MPAAESSTERRTKKRIILCCDGTWFDADSGYNKPSRKNPHGSLQVASNVTRISRCFRRRCSDGTLQIINYQSGVGTSSNTLDTLTGGIFGIGLEEVCYKLFLTICHIVFLSWAS